VVNAIAELDALLALLKAVIKLILLRGFASPLLIAFWSAIDAFLYCMVALEK